MDFITAIALLIFAWAATLSGVLVGGFLVFKASGGTALFNTNRGGAFNIADGADDIDVDTERELPPELGRHLNRFKSVYDPGSDLFGGEARQPSRHGAARPFTAPVPPPQGASDDDVKKED